MLTSVRGVYRKGRVRLTEVPKNVRDDTRVIVTFLDSGGIDLRKRGIRRAQAAELRARLAAFANDWESPEMDVYDNYDASKTKM